jgi:hypothetical protein
VPFSIDHVRRSPFQIFADAPALPASSQCVSKCCEKFLKHSSRVSMRFAELNQVTQPPGH